MEEKLEEKIEDDLVIREKDNNISLLKKVIYSQISERYDIAKKSQAPEGQNEMPKEYLYNIFNS